MAAPSLFFSLSSPTLLLFPETPHSTPTAFQGGLSPGQRKTWAAFGPRVASAPSPAGSRTGQHSWALLSLWIGKEGLGAQYCHSSMPAPPSPLLGHSWKPVESLPPSCPHSWSRGWSSDNLCIRGVMDRKPKSSGSRNFKLSPRISEREKNTAGPN